MKKPIYFIFAVLIAITSCKKSENKAEQAANPTAYMTAQKNNALWKPFLQTIISNDTMAISAKSVSYNTTVSPSIATTLDTMHIQVPYNGVSTYSLHSSQVKYSVYNADGSTSNYKLDTTFNNVLTITGYLDLHNPATLNPDEHEITGTFSLKFIDPKDPNGIKFSNGSFYDISYNFSK